MSAGRPPVRSDLDGRAAIVTGGARGIGHATVQRLAELGAHVVSLDVDAPPVTEPGVPQAHHASGDVRFHLCDVTDEQQVERAMDEMAADLGGIDILVNNAGRPAHFDATTMSSAQWDDLFSLNVKATWYCAKHALPYLLKSQHPAIVNVASIHALRTTPGMFPYAATKAGLVGLTQTLALDYAKHHVRVNAVCPGWIRTRQVEESFTRHEDPARVEAEVVSRHPIGRIGEPRDVANAVAFLASDDASFVTGTTLVVDGGFIAQFDG